ncbi:YveK family protein [Alkalicoccobacillus murimartini]|uniref:Capsular polysaccharide biosynthesis protein n=1 Tax=Alkalicoccobacillus murimartini TaxID=171685 RepID=A0ABT9YHN3_9BACI|nr:Wzz/FepE/Etk N-terminal domain-containing protein [Alkalicoccobacillus murimartini]MDQ0207000.1 capsular polysaccharide biosynthesis protein [Alkalicoccobacillus murimartini]
MEETISLKDIFQTLRRRLKLLIFLPVIAMVVAAAVSFFVLTPMYQNSTQILVNQTNPNPENAFSQNDIRTNIEMISTYNEIIKSPFILDKVIEESGVDLTTGSLNQMITVNSANESQVMNITVEDSGAEEAAMLANTIATVFQEEVPDLMNIENVSILSPATVAENQSQVSPNSMLNIAIAFVVGLMAAVGLAFLLEYFDTTIKTEKDLEDALDMPVLGAISNMDSVDDFLKKSS